QVWQNGHRLFQGAVISAKDFIEKAITDKFGTSLLADITDLQISYAGELIQNSSGKISSYRSRSNSSLDQLQRSSLNGETLLSMSLSEPFSQFNFVFKVNKMPLGAGAAFINTLAFSLLTILVMGTYFIYRVTIKQSNLAQQQQDFVSSVSHELKTPLTSIRMYGEILKQGWLAENKREEYYDYIYNESERLSRLIANVLQISKVNHNALDLNIEEIEISEVVNLIKSKLDSQIEQSEFSLNIQVDDQLCDQTMSIDIDAFVQIIINLVDNALKYAKSAENKQIDVIFKSTNKNVVEVLVRDYGAGISKSQIRKIFDLFYRSGDELTRTTTGTGIGLALVKELSMAMGAKIEAVNQNPGVKFSILFSQ
ncbi:MAG: HAMP domain-containing histidine kinase, partial [Kangiellaceae bacterium]|nr:HAMP domain-containing histidine kinase [Kangiellaceae bacterium]